MTAGILERDRIYEYQTMQEVMDVLEDEGLDLSDAEWMSAIYIQPQVMEVDGEGKLFGMPTKSVMVFVSDEGPTGFYKPGGKPPILIINSYELVDYDLVSSLHPIKDADVYMHVVYPYEIRSTDLIVVHSWFRDETYLDHFKEEEE